MKNRAQRWLAGWFALPRHWFSWLTCIVVALGAFLILVPGECDRQSGRRHAEPILLPDQRPRLGKDGLRFASDPAAPRQVFEYAHGWPWTYLRRAKGYGGSAWPKLGAATQPRISYPKGRSAAGVPISWSVPDAWPFSSDRSEWRIGILVLDAAVVVGLILLSSSAAENWLRRRKRLWRLRVMDIIVATTLVALAMGWWQWHEGQQEIERSIYVESTNLRRGRAAGFEQAIAGNTHHDVVDRTPIWLRRLLGTSQFTPWCRHIRQPFDNAITAERLERDWQSYSRLYYLEHVTLRAEPSAEVLGQLQHLQQLRSLEIRLHNGDANFDEVLIDLSALAKMPNLEKLDLMCPYLLVDDLMPLLDSPSLRGVRLQKASIMQSELKTFVEDHRPRFALTHEEEVTPWGVAYVQLARWMAEDRINYSQLAKLQVGTIDLTALKVNSARLKRLGIVCDGIRHLAFDAVGQVAGLWEFVNQCRNLETLQLGNYPMTPAELTTLLPLQHLESMQCEQGKLTPESIMQLANILSLEEVEIHNVSWSLDELRSIESAFDASRSGRQTGLFLSAYRDRNDETPIDTAVADPGGPFDF